MLKKIYIRKKQDERLHKLDIPVIGLTGGIATGKSTVAQMLKSKNICVIDADVLIKKIYKLPEIISYIEQKVPEVVSNKEINFKKLRDEFFSNKQLQKELEGMLYPHLKDFFLAELKEFQKEHSPSFVVYDVPLLFERGIDQYVDLKVLVYCPRDMQIKRLVVRDHISEALAEKILNAQMDIEDKKKKSDLIIENTSDLTMLTQKVDQFLQNITGV